MLLLVMRGLYLGCGVPCNLGFYAVDVSSNLSNLNAEPWALDLEKSALEGYQSVAKAH